MNLTPTLSEGEGVKNRRGFTPLSFGEGLGVRFQKMRKYCLLYIKSSEFIISFNNKNNNYLPIVITNQNQNC